MVSIIIPVYNIEKYLHRAVESAINQTYRDTEIIIVDDGSTDSSPEKCDAYMKKDSRVKVIHKENGGLSSARNAGIAAAKGDYVLLLDGDDFLDTSAAEKLMKVSEEYPSDIIQFRYSEEGGSEAEKTDIYQASAPKELFENLYKTGGEAASSCTKLFRRDLLLAVPFENVQHEDEMWCTRAFQKNLTCTYIPDILYYYVMREGSITHTVFNNRKLDVFIITDERIKALRKTGLEELVHLEYERMFFSVLSLYTDASKAGNKEALEKIRQQFENNKKAIAENAKLQGKYNLIFRSMCRDFNAVKMYRLYWKLKDAVK